jgi:MarR family transcriptional regulator, negative regulator of the multidrug operon emrRAB
MTTKSANLLGALSLALTDKFSAAMEEELGIGGIAGSALVLIDAETDITIESLAKVLHTAQSSLTRAVQQLVNLGHVKKLPGKDRRTLILKITAKGEKKLSRMLERRAVILDAALSVLPREAQAGFSASLEVILSELLQSPEDRFKVCRLCDEDSCGEQSECPVERGATALARAQVFSGEQL